MKRAAAAAITMLGGRPTTHPPSRPRVRTADGTGEFAIPAYELCSSTEVLDEMALGRMLGKLSSHSATPYAWS